MAKITPPKGKHNHKTEPDIPALEGEGQGPIGTPISQGGVAPDSSESLIALRSRELHAIVDGIGSREGINIARSRAILQALPAHQKLGLPISTPPDSPPVPKPEPKVEPDAVATTVPVLPSAYKSTTPPVLKALDPSGDGIIWIALSIVMALWIVGRIFAP
jgi:hypothetical protein